MTIWSNPSPCSLPCSPYPLPLFILSSFLSPVIKTYCTFLFHSIHFICIPVNWVKILFLMLLTTVLLSSFCTLTSLCYMLSYLICLLQSCLPAFNARWPASNAYWPASNTCLLACTAHRPASNAFCTTFSSRYPSSPDRCTAADKL